MKRILFLIILAQFSLVHHGQIIVDHTAVDKYDQIPQHYINEVKKMLVDVTGQSHNAGYSHGVDLLKALDNRFQASFYGWKNIVPNYTNLYLRIGSQYGAGEQHWFTTQDSINKMKQWITTQASTGNPFDVILFTWCYDMYSMRWNATLGNRDPVYDVRWYGSTENGPDGNNPFGLNSQDSDLTNNRISIDTYLDATEQYIQHCKANNFATKIIFTTGPVDNTGSPGNTEGTEKGLQREIKHQYIRDYVSKDASRILFDYADILVHNNNGEKYVTQWNDNGKLRPHVNIHPDNMKDYDASWNLKDYKEKGMHIGDVGALRIAKAMWYMLARIAGWDGSVTTTPVTGITVKGAGGSTTITTAMSTLQLSATITPTGASNKNVTWSIQNGTGQATINSSGLVTAASDGKVTARATAKDGSGVFGELTLTIDIQGVVMNLNTETSENTDFKVMVNRGNLEVIFNEDQYSGKRISLYNMVGHLIARSVVEGNSSYFDTSSLPKGIYIIAPESTLHKPKKVNISW